MDELIERLRNFEGSDDLGNGDFSLLREAAAALEAAELREARMHDAMRQATERLAAVARECEELRAACSDERLVEALRWIASDDTAKGCDDGMQEVEAIKQRARATLRDHDQETKK